MSNSYEDWKLSICQTVTGTRSYLCQAGTKIGSCVYQTFTGTGVTYVSYRDMELPNLHHTVTGTGSYLCQTVTESYLC